MGLLNYNKLLFLLLLLPFVSFGQNISGRVNDKKTNVALVGALVTLYNNDKIVGSTTVKRNGEFALPISVNINYIDFSFI